LLEKFSVRKPFTVLGGVILVVVLGIMSVVNTSTDLLPTMDLPITAIMTTYIGATPEQVEQSVSIPIETRMSTLSGIDTVQSISTEHMVASEHKLSITGMKKNVLTDEHLRKMDVFVKALLS
jgi:HAE1 family hydrophobic/amphiphilic exporter-1